MESRRQHSRTKLTFYDVSCFLPLLISYYRHPQPPTAHSLGQMSPTRKFEKLSSPQPPKRLPALMAYHFSVLGKHTTPSPHGSINCFAHVFPTATTHSAGGKLKEQSSLN